MLETDGSNIIQVVYTLQPMLYGNLISQRRSGTTSFYLFDGLGSTTQLANSTGSVTDSYLYDSFGNILLTSGTTVNSFRYVGRVGYYVGVDLGQYYMRARYYSPGIGRFLSRDPLGVPEPVTTSVFSQGLAPWLQQTSHGLVEIPLDSSNPYLYGSNNASKIVDPSGLQGDVTQPEACGLAYTTCLFVSWTIYRVCMLWPPDPAPAPGTNRWRILGPIRIWIPPVYLPGKQQCIGYHIKLNIDCELNLKRCLRACK